MKCKGRFPLRRIRSREPVRSHALAISLAVAHFGREKVELDLTSRTGRGFASERSLSAWISSCACPDSPSLGRATEFAEVEIGLKEVTNSIALVMNRTLGVATKYTRPYGG